MKGLLVAIAISLLTPVFAGDTAGDKAAEKWREDLAFLASELPERHKNLFFSLSREEFEKKVARLDREIPKLSDVQIMLRMSEIVASVGDGHTRIYADRSAMRVLPLRLGWFRDGIFVTGATRKFGDAFGARLVTVGGKPVDELLPRVRALISHDNESAFRNEAPGPARIRAH